MFEQPKERFNSFFDWMYDDYEKWLLLPALMLLLAFGVIGYSYVTTGDIVNKGIEFTGGSEIKIQVNDSVSQDAIEQAFSGELQNVRVRTLSGRGGTTWMLVQTSTTFSRDSGNATANGSDIEQIGVTEQVSQLLQSHDIPHGDISAQSLGAAVSQSFLREAQIAVALAFLIMSAVIFVAFRNFVPSMAVILAAFTDIIVAIAGMNLIGIELTLGSLAALLMLIGYSVDTDIVLSTRVLRQNQGSLKERVRDSITTGATMTVGALTAFTALFLISTSPTLDEIAAVMLLGLLADIPITWTGNAIILKMHEEGKL
ncbi:MAG: protein translocase subunit SecF [Candidatus Nanohaloarchaea archaeon]|nr:protein translocase subunit SecF [Candidatus Nanohaloarchaea archaeon]